jgi:hypothetical protein
LAGYQNGRNADIVLPLKSEQSTDQLKASGNPEQANTVFRTNILSILKQLTLEYKLPEPDDNFVMVNPMASVVSPVALIKEATMASLFDLEKGEDILLAYF